MQTDETDMQLRQAEALERMADAAEERNEKLDTAIALLEGMGADVKELKASLPKMPKMPRMGSLLKGN